MSEGLAGRRALVTAVATLDRSGGDVVADVRDEVAVERAVAEAARLLGGPPDLVVASAGIYPSSRLSARRPRSGTRWWRRISAASS
ncbi:MAG: hypothetical protein ABJA81_04320 [Nocardioidaceae bacterium]